VIASRWPPNPAVHALVVRSQTPMRRSFPPLARTAPSELSASAQISSVCPCASSARAFPFPFLSPLRRTFGKCATRLPEDSSKRVMLPSLLAVKSDAPSVDASAAVTGMWCRLECRKEGDV
jgi:hypothetical protein